MNERRLPSKSELESWLRHPVTRVLMDDIKEREEDSKKISTSTLLVSQKEVAEVNKQIGILENIAYILAFPTLLLNDIITEQERNEGKETE